MRPLMRFMEKQEEYIVRSLRDERLDELDDDELRKKVHALTKSYQKKRFGDLRTREANILLAGCRPEQLCADAPIGGDYHGAFTYYLCESIVEANGQITYRQLAEETGKRLYDSGFLQVPQLEYRGNATTSLRFSRLCEREASDDFETNAQSNRTGRTDRQDQA